MAPSSEAARRATIQRIYDFEAAHRLPSVAEGHKCGTMHGHSYQVVVQLTGPVQQSGADAGMVVDFMVLDSIARDLKERVDHATLNDVLHTNPTVENMVPLVWNHFASALSHVPSLAETSWRLKVWLHEGPRSIAIYPPEET